MKKLLIIFLVFPSLVLAASFDCNNATSLSEMMICNDAELSRLDDELSIIYNQLKETVTDKQKFKQQTKSAWQWREKNCRTKDCLISWYQNRKAILQSFSTTKYQYESQKVTLSGKLLSADGETPDGEAIKYPALQLIKPITVEGDQESPTEKGVILLHMVLDENMMEIFKKYKGQLVTVNGTLFHSITGHHQTNVLIEPFNISITK